MRQAITIILSLAVLALFVGLGTWQVQRLHWKEGVLAEIDARIAADPVCPCQRCLTRRVTRICPSWSRGMIWRPGYSARAVSTKQAGAGYRLISPLQTDQGAILIDRGFIRVADEMPPVPEVGPVTDRGQPALA